MSTQDVIAGMQIILPYYDQADGGFNTGADHDVIYMYATDKPVSAEDIAKIKELGWFQTDVEEDDDGNVEYDVDSGWQKFV